MNFGCAVEERALNWAPENHQKGHTMFNAMENVFGYTTGIWLSSNQMPPVPLVNYNPYINGRDDTDPIWSH